MFSLLIYFGNEYIIASMRWFYDKNNTGEMMSKIVNDLFDVSELAHHGPEDLFNSFISLTIFLFSSKLIFFIILCLILFLK